MVARTTPARRAIADMLASGSLASASTAASRMRATLRSASARRRGGVVLGVIGHAWLVDCDPRRDGELREEAARRRKHDERGGARDRRDDGGREEGVADPAGDGARRVAIVARTAMPSEPPISCPVVFRPESIPLSSSAAPVSTATETETRTIPRPRPATSMPGSTSAT